MKINKEDLKQYIIAGAVLLSIVSISLLAYKFLFTNHSPKTKEQISANKIKGIGETPEETLTKFISNAGTIGNPDKVTIEALKNKTALLGNAERRKESYKESIPSLATTSDILIGNNEKYISDYAVGLQFPEYYTVSDVKVSKASPEYTLYKEKLNNGSSKAVDVYATFTSTKTIFRQKTLDSSSDGTVLRISNKENFNKIKFTLIKLGKKDWRIFSVDDNNTIGSRFSTWNTQSKDYIDQTKNTVISELK